MQSPLQHTDHPPERLSTCRPSVGPFDPAHLASMQLNSLHVQLPQRCHRDISRALAPTCPCTVHTHTARRQLHQQQQQLSSSRLLRELGFDAFPEQSMSQFITSVCMQQLPQSSSSVGQQRLIHIVLLCFTLQLLTY